MKCDKCGFIPNPGDQVCINCGAKLSLNAYEPEIITNTLEKTKKDNKKILILSIIGVIILIIIIFLIIKFIFFK